MTYYNLKNIYLPSRLALCIPWNPNPLFHPSASVHTQIHTQRHRSDLHFDNITYLDVTFVQRHYSKIVSNFCNYTFVKHLSGFIHHT